MKVTGDEATFSSFFSPLGETTRNSVSSRRSCFGVARGRQLKPHMPQWPTEGGRSGPSCVEAKQWVLGDIVCTADPQRLNKAKSPADSISSRQIEINSQEEATARAQHRMTGRAAGRGWGKMSLFIHVRWTFFYKVKQRRAVNDCCVSTSGGINSFGEFSTFLPGDRLFFFIGKKGQV